MGARDAHGQHKCWDAMLVMCLRLRMLIDSRAGQTDRQAVSELEARQPLQLVPHPTRHCRCCWPWTLRPQARAPPTPAPVASLKKPKENSGTTAAEARPGTSRTCSEQSVGGAPQAEAPLGSRAQMVEGAASRAPKASPATASCRRQQRSGHAAAVLSLSRSRCALGLMPAQLLPSLCRRADHAAPAPSLAAGGSSR